MRTLSFVPQDLLPMSIDFRPFTRRLTDLCSLWLGSSSLGSRARPCVLEIKGSDGLTGSLSHMALSSKTGGAMPPF